MRHREEGFDRFRVAIRLLSIYRISMSNACRSTIGHRQSSQLEGNGQASSCCSIMHAAHDSAGKRTNGVDFTYDKVASLLAPKGGAEPLAVAHHLGSKSPELKSG
jgi:hypothetical protein